MEIVVTTRSVDPIDLTASLVKAKYMQEKKIPCTVKWVVETSSPDSIFYELRKLASHFDKIDIRVERQEDVSVLNPDKTKLITLLKTILEYIDTSRGMIRIQHGAIVLERDTFSVRCRYFGWKYEKLLLCDNKKNPTFYYVDMNDSQKLTFQGSMNLCLIKNYGEFAHLPWYCIDSSIYPFEVEEVITPPEGCSYARFGVESTRLIPFGYSVYDFFSIKDCFMFTMESWLCEKGSVIFSRQAGGTRCAKDVLLKISSDVLTNIKEKGFYNYLYSLGDDLSSSEKILISLIEIRELSRIMISFDRGFYDKVYSTSLIDENNELKITREEILNILIRVTDTCLKKISLFENSFSFLLSGKDKPFGILAKAVLRKAVQYFNLLYYEYYYKNKATIPNLLKYSLLEKADTDFLDTLLKKRTSSIMHVTRGSIFEFETFTAINSKMARSR